MLSFLGIIVCLTLVKGDNLLFSDEKYFSNVKQLTFGGDHSFPDFSDDGRQLVFSANGGPYGIGCDQVFRLNLDDHNEKPARLSPGFGVATRPKFWPNTKDVVFQSNFDKTSYPSDFIATATCPLSTCRPSNQQKNTTIANLCKSPTWDIFKDQNIFRVTKYGNIVQQYTNNTVYAGDAWGKKDNQMIYYSANDDNGINVYTANIKLLSTPSLITHQGINYFGGIAKDSDDRRIVYHGYRPSTAADKANLLQSLSYNLIPASRMDIYTSEFDGNDPQIVKVVQGYISHDPVFANSNGNKIVFASNYNRSMAESLFLYNINYNDGSSGDEMKGLQSLSTMQGSIATKYAAISNDFNKIVFASNRNSTNSNEFQLFIADFNVTGSSPDPFDGGHFAVASRLAQKTMLDPRNSDSKDATNEQCWQNQPVASQYDGILHYPGEKRLKNIKQLTFGGQNAEGYFSRDNKRLTIQATGNKMYGTGCDQIYQIDLCKDPAKTLPHKMSTGLGACTCSFIYPDGKQSLYAATFKAVKIGGSTTADSTCPMKQCSDANPALTTDQTLNQLCNTSYTWDIFPDYDIYLVNEYGIITQQLTNSPGYDAEGVISPDGTMIAFTSMRNGDLDIYIMDLQGKNVRQITNVTGYDGGAFFSPDSKRLIFRASRPKPGPELEKYQQLLKYNLVEPISMELFVINVDGTNMKQITNLTAANWAPYYYSDNKRIIFSSDFAATAGFGAFDLYMINDDGTGLERITWDNGQFDSFPMFNYDGTKLVWGSSRNGSEYDLNLFIADWVDSDATQSSSTLSSTATVPSTIQTSSITLTPGSSNTPSSGVVTTSGPSTTGVTHNGGQSTPSTTHTSSAPSPIFVNFSVFLILIFKALF
uniref:Uncharacterized protein n=1 Tax=Panagrolaimus superbus TaxID=310955 RepID=A0A914YPT6_9BILA